MSIINTKKQEETAFKAMKESFKYTNVMQAPRITKVIVSSGVGSVKDKNKVALVGDRLAKITGQKAAPRGARASIASFKVREGDVVGYQTTLRGSRMYEFLDKLLNIALPRTKDFRGVPTSGIDNMGNYTLGIKESTIFPETAEEELKDVFGMSVTVVSTAGGKEEAKAFFEHLGFPFGKVEERRKKSKK